MKMFSNFILDSFQVERAPATQTEPFFAPDTVVAI